jgi:hypothetical protein
MINATISSPCALRSPLAPSIYRNYSKANLQLFHESLSQVKNSIQNSIENKDSIDKVWNSFKSGLFNSIDKAVPLRVNKLKPPHEPYWFNNIARKACNKQRRLYSKYKKTGNPYVLVQYKQLRRENKKLFRILKKDYLMNSLYKPLKAGNTKYFYQFVRKTRGDQSSIKSIENELGDLTQDPSYMANAFNQYFQSVFSPSHIMPPLPVATEPDFQITKEGVM